MVHAVKSVLGDAEVYLTGSVVEGKTVPSSDIDVLITSESADVRKATKRAEIIARIEEESGLPFVHPFEFHLMTKDEFQEWREVFKPSLIKLA